MAKAKPKAIIMAADGAGGMAQVQDRRFEAGNWPIRFEVPKEQADTWLQYLSAECGRRGWSSGGIAQLEAKENSGSQQSTPAVPGSCSWLSSGNGNAVARSRSGLGLPERLSSLLTTQTSFSDRSTNAAGRVHPSNSIADGNSAMTGFLGLASCGSMKH